MIEPERLADTLGAVREGVTCIENLAQLLGSRRVGPRQLPHALPEVQAGCVTLVESLATLETVLGEQLGGDAESTAALQKMLGHASGRVQELGATLEGREKAPIEAKERLMLLSLVSRVAAELSAVMRLTDLIGAASRKKTILDLSEVLARRPPEGRSVMKPVPAVVELRSEQTLVADARIMLALVEFAVAMVARAGVDKPRIVAEEAADGSLVISVGAAAGEPVTGTRTQVIDVARRAELPEEATLVRAAASRAGISLEVGEGGRAVTIIVK